MKDEYWKKRYEIAIAMLHEERPAWTIDDWKMAIEEEIETEEIGMERTVEDAKVRKVNRDDTP